MTMTDPIADMLTRIRNAVRNKRKSVDMPTSRVKASIADVLKREGFIDGYEVLADGVQGTLRLRLRYDEDGVPAITAIDRESKPGRRVFRGVTDLPKVVGGLGVSILTTPKGVLSDREARRERVGGEVLCSVS
jgi:small subunit ribosomal protein S8